jgi:ribonucleotide monophosphatase NagD (HAD superfamily)
MRAVLIDIDGVLTVSWKPLPGAVAALHQLRTAGVPLALVTNTTSRTRASIASVLAGAGFPVTASDVLTAPVIAAAYLRDRYPGARCLLLNSGDIGEDLAGLTLAREGDQAPADVVLIGGDIDTDVLAAQRQGLTGVLVKTGKYLPRAHRAAAGTPDHVLDSFAGLPVLLEQLS